MKRKYKPIDLKEFTEADDIIKPSIKGEMRKVYPEIHRKITLGGWSANDVVNWFNERGIPMTENLFRVYLNDIDRENGFVRKSKKNPSNPLVETKSSMAASAVIKIERANLPIANSLVQTAQSLNKNQSKENEKIEYHIGIPKLLEDGSLNPDYINLMRKKSKE